MGHKFSITTITHFFGKVEGRLKFSIFLLLYRDLWGPKDLVSVISFWRFYVHFEDLEELFKMSIDTLGAEVSPFWVLGLASRPKVEDQILGTHDFFRTNFFRNNFFCVGPRPQIDQNQLKKNWSYKNHVSPKFDPPLLVDLQGPKLKKGVLRPPMYLHSFWRALRDLQSEHKIVKN
jgi:hypothetical protein